MTPRPTGARGAQHVEARTIAVIDFEAKLGGAADHFRTRFDDGNIDSARQQRLTSYLPEPPKPDDQNIAGQSIGHFDSVEGRQSIRRQIPRRKDQQRRESHRKDDNCGQSGIHPIRQKAAFGGGRVKNEGEFAALDQDGGL